MSVQVHILPDDLRVCVKRSETLLKACYDAGITLDSPCGGRGTCGKCVVRILGDDNDTPVLACQYLVDKDCTIEIPAGSRLARQHVMLETQAINVALDPMCRKIRLKMDEPDLTDAINDLDRLRLALVREGMDDAYISLDVLQRLPDVLRQHAFDVTVSLTYDGSKWKVVDVEGTSAKPAYGLAVDIGTTTVAAYLVDTQNGKVVDKAGTYNKQSLYGSDVISRIVHAVESKQGAEQLQKAVVDSINELIYHLLNRNKLQDTDIKAAVFAGNTVMTHLFLRVTAEFLRLEPYVPAACAFPPVRASDLGLHMHPEAVVLTVPSVASYVGGDITAGVMTTDLSASDALTLFIDIGTNGEMVLGNSDWAMTCSCSAGPAFEGSGISCGMRAMDGAIDSVECDANGIKISVIGRGAPLGICGTGLIRAIKAFKEGGLIDRSGQFVQTQSNRYRMGEDGAQYVLAWKGERGAPKDVVLTENDIKNLMRAKAAIFAGIRAMLKYMQLETDVIDRVIIAGGFGSFINIPDAIAIGMLPDIPLEKYTYVGNSSLRGALTILLSREHLSRAQDTANAMTYLELSVGNTFMEEFISAIFLPHTDLSLFPSVKS